MIGTDYVKFEDPDWSKRCPFGNYFISQRFAVGVSFYLMIPSAWFILAYLGVGIGKVILSWGVFGAMNWLASLISNYVNQVKFQKLLHYAAGICGLLGGLVSLSGFYVGSELGVDLFIVSRALQGVWLGGYRRAEQIFLKSVCTEKDANSITKLCEFWEGIAVVLGILLFLVCGLLKYLRVEGLILVLIAEVLLGLVSCFITFLYFPEFPLYLNMALGSKETFPYLGALEDDDYYLIVRRDLIYDYKTSNVFPVPSYTGYGVLLALFIASNAYSMCLYSVFPYQIETLGYTGWYSLGVWFIVITVMGSLSTVLVNYLTDKAFIAKFLLVVNYSIAVVWGVLFASRVSGFYLGMYTSVVLLSFLVPCGVKFTHVQLGLVLGPKPKKFLKRLVELGGALGWGLGILILGTVPEGSNGFYGASTAVWMCLSVFISGLFNSWQEHVSFAMRRPGDSVKPIKFPNQLREEASKALLDPSFEVPEQEGFLVNGEFYSPSKGVLERVFN